MTDTANLVLLSSLGAELSEEEAGVEVCILIDQSSSMMGSMGKVSEVLWTIKRSFDELEFRTTVLGFDTSHYILFQPSDVAPRGYQPVFGCDGGTDPHSALQQAHAVLSRTHMPNRALFIITDGQWQGTGARSSEGLIRSLRKDLEVYTCLLGLNGAVSYFGDHECEVAKDILTIEELIPLAKEFVVRTMQRVRAEHQHV